VKTLRLGSTDEDILAAVREWISLLAREEYVDAHQFTFHADNDYWTPESLKLIIQNYGSPEPYPDGRTFRVTRVESATGDSYHQAEIRREALNRGRVWYDLPLNGEWSDLTAIFALQAIDGKLVLILEDIHVL
jgi:hypothetical protein